MAEMQADYVIVGAGSAGCAMAYRLAEAGESVLVIEHGGTDIGPLIQMPAALSYPMNMKMYDWGYESEPEPHLDGRRLACPRGKVIGGSSWTGQFTAAKMWLRFGKIAPIITGHIHWIGEGARHLDEGARIRPAVFQHQN